QLLKLRLKLLPLLRVPVATGLQLGATARKVGEVALVVGKASGQLLGVRPLVLEQQGELLLSARALGQRGAQRLQPGRVLLPAVVEAAERRLLLGELRLELGEPCLQSLQLLPRAGG